jgi:DNA-binding CsgD family transcriptional regulator
MNKLAQKLAKVRRERMQRLLASGKSKAEVARMYGISRQRINQLFPPK